MPVLWVLAISANALLSEGGRNLVPGHKWFSPGDVALFVLLAPCWQGKRLLGNLEKLF